MSKRRKAHEVGHPDGGKPKTVFKIGKTGNTLGIVWNPLPSGVEKLNTVLTGIVVPDTRQWMEGALEHAYKVEGMPYRDQIPPNLYRVVVCTALAPVGFQRFGEVTRYADGRMEQSQSDGEVAWFTPPNAVFDLRFTETDLLTGVDRMFSTTERVRNYIAFVSLMVVPIAVVYSSKSFFTGMRYEAPTDGYAPQRMPATNKEVESVTRGYGDSFDNARKLLLGIPPESPLGRAVSLIGEAICTRDTEERFFYAWRALEVLGNFDLSHARKQATEGDRDAARPYIERGVDTLLNAQPVKVDALAKVAVSVRTRDPSVSEVKIDEFYELRNAIAHGDVTIPQHARILPLSAEVLMLARKLVAQAVFGEYPELNPRHPVE